MSRRQPDTGSTTGKLLAKRRAGEPKKAFSRPPSPPGGTTDDDRELEDHHRSNPVVGLSSADIEALLAERKAMLSDLEATEHGRELVRRSDQQVDQAGQGLAEDIRALARTARGDTGHCVGARADNRTLNASRSAAVVLDELAAVWQEERCHDLAASRSPLYRWAQDGHRWMDATIRFQNDDQPRSLRQRLLARYWGGLGNVFTFAAASVLFWGSAFQWAAALIAARILVTTAVWAMSAYPSDDSPQHPVLDSDPRICVLGHAGDLLLFSSFAAALIGDGRVGMAFAVILASWVMILGTLLRITATGGGSPVPRLHLERVVRGGSTLTAISLASLGTEPTWWAAAAIIVALPSIFAFIEGQEALRALSFRAPIRSAGSGEVAIEADWPKPLPVP